jgi:hypothetical protein
MADVERWSEWTPSVTSIKRLDPGPLRPGTRLFIRQPKLPPALWRVVSVEEGNGFVSISSAPGVRVTANHFIESTPDGSRATLSIHFGGMLGGLVGRMIRGINERYLALEAKGLKERSEG